VVLPVENFAANGEHGLNCLCQPRGQPQKTVEGVTAKRYLATGDLAKEVGMKEDYAAMNKVCSKLVHPTAWSVLAMNKGTNSFPQARDILFASGVGYISQIYLATDAHNASQGMKPNS
jgi:hypothetical protein